LLPRARLRERRAAGKGGGSRDACGGGGRGGSAQNALKPKVTARQDGRRGVAKAGQRENGATDVNQVANKELLRQDEDRVRREHNRLKKINLIYARHVHSPRVHTYIRTWGHCR